ncbi:transglutaminase domain-containing protein [Methanobrevibacter filiformis]|uniref:Pseudomurein-binding repeat protein n=1 Tax=Methanobrevibacter filiformis TaxID=55758 RepID=A0A166DJ27_9EURY|nr:transglutaminase domain-containing protein [Methanobrevibacter filiformis]KZX15650.1 pseudomurein-binding repeat protein [Methanobrevibacter filiformis]
MEINFLKSKVVVLCTIFVFFVAISGIHGANLDNGIMDSNNNYNSFINDNQSISNQSNKISDLKKISTPSSNNGSNKVSNKDSSKNTNKKHINLAAAGENKLTTLSQSSILSAGVKVKDYIRSKKKLPDYITISSQNFSMTEYMYMLSKTVYYKYSNNKNNVAIKYNIKNPSKPAGSDINKEFSKSTYISLSKKIIKYIDTNNKAPNYVTSGNSKFQYQSLIYFFSEILGYVKVKGELPRSVAVAIKSSNGINKYLPKFDTGSKLATSTSTKTSKAKTITLKLSSILDGSKRVKDYVESYGKLPNYVSVSGKNYNMANFLYLMSNAIINTKNKKTTNIQVISVKMPSKDSGSIKNGKISKNTYITLANNAIKYISSKKQAPNNLKTNIGSLKFSLTVYTFSKILSHVKSKKVLPSSISVKNTSIKELTIEINMGSGNYLKSTKNAQAMDVTIKDLSNSITKNSKNDQQKANAIFEWVKYNIDYSFYYNTRYGAVNTLKNKIGNCVDTTHLLIALSRASGLGARYVHGYCEFSSGTTYGHVWAQIWIDNKWVTADAISLRNNLGTINNWDTSSYTLKGIYTELPF